MALIKNKNLVPIICGVSYILMEDIQSFNPGTDISTRYITFQENKKPQGIYYGVGSAEFTEDEKQDDPGSLFEQRLKIIFPGEDRTNAMTFIGLINRPVVILLKYSTGLIKIMGCPDNPAILLTKHQISSKQSNKELDFICTSTDPAYVWDLQHLPPEVEWEEEQ